MDTATEQFEQVVPAERRFRRYLAAYAAPLLLGLFAAAGFNALVDPYEVYPAAHLDALDDYRLHRNSRTAKAELLARSEPGAALVGTSRVAVGYDPEHEAIGRWLDADAPGAASINLGLAAGTRREMIHVLEAVLDRGGVELVVFGLDFSLFDVGGETAWDFEQSLFNPQRALLPYHVDNLVSLRATTDSLGTVRARLRDRRVVWDERGFRSRPKRDFDRREAFRVEIGNFVSPTGPYGGFSYSESARRELASVLTRCREAGVLVLAVINPIHFSHLLAVEEMGLWEDFERFKREAASFAASAGGDAPPLLVFDGAFANRFTTEPLPESGPMQWWWESSHFQATLGDLALDQMMAVATDEPASSSRPLRRLTPETVEGHLRETRRAFERAIRDDPALVEWVQAVVAENRSNSGG